MNTAGLVSSWDECAIVWEDQIVRLKDRFVFCLGYQEKIDATIMDNGGEDYSAVCLRIVDNKAYSVNPDNPQETTLLGPLIALNQIKEVTQDLFLTPPDFAILHQCNCYNRMGAGLAKEIAKRYPEAEEADRQYLPYASCHAKLGGYSIAQSEKEKRWIFNVYGQEEFGDSTERHTSYDALDRAFRQIAKDLLVWKKDKPRGIAIPRGIGCGPGGGDWGIVREIIDCAFGDTGIPVLICEKK